jgi:hypothetical protein
MLNSGVTRICGVIVLEIEGEVAVVSLRMSF